MACVGGGEGGAYRVVVGKPKQMHTQNFSFAPGAWGWGWWEADLEAIYKIRLDLKIML